MRGGIGRNCGSGFEFEGNEVMPVHNQTTFESRPRLFAIRSSIHAWTSDSSHLVERSPSFIGCGNSPFATSA